MMSRLVSDLFDISEAAHHGPENFIYLSCKDRWIFYFPVYHSVEISDYSSCDRFTDDLLQCKAKP